MIKYVVLILLILIALVGVVPHLVEGGMTNRVALDLSKREFASLADQSDLETWDTTMPYTSNQWRLAGGAALRAGECDVALSDFDAALELAPHDPLALFGQGQTRECLGDHDGALQAWRAAKAEPWFSQQALAQLRAGDTGAALHFAQQAAELDSGSAQVFQVLGEALRSQQRYDEAIAAFERAVTLQPGVGEHEYFLARTLADAGRWDEGLRRCVQVMEQQMPRRVAACQMLYGLYYETHLDYAQAAQWYEIASRSADPVALRGLGRMQLAQGDVAVATQTLARAVQQAPDSADVQIELARAYHILGQLLPAVEAYERGLKIMTDFDRSNLLVEYADTLAAAGKIAEACQAYAKALSQLPQPGDVETKMAALRCSS
jgi:tetratricopeptide (TPR) repeat protein